MRDVLRYLKYRCMVYVHNDIYLNLLGRCVICILCVCKIQINIVTHTYYTGLIRIKMWSVACITRISIKNETAWSNVWKYCTIDVSWRSHNRNVCNIVTRSQNLRDDVNNALCYRIHVRVVEMSVELYTLLHCGYWSNSNEIHRIGFCIKIIWKFQGLNKTGEL